MTFPHPTGNSRPSYWIETTPETAYPPVQGDARADVVIVGGGIVGLTSAYLLAKAGRSVLVVDRERIAMAETGHTTAHLQIVLDTRLRDLVPRFGLKGAKLGWDSQMEAVRLIESIARDERIACELVRTDAYLYANPSKPEDADMLREEIRLARKIGYEAHEADPGEVPYGAAFAVRFPDQGKFHVRKYLLGVARAAERMGARIHEGTEVAAIEEGAPARVRTRDGHTLTGDWVIQATNTPSVANELIHTNLYPYRTYAIGAYVPRGVFQERLYWDTEDPYHYTRVEQQGARDLVILGGEDHKVGAQSDTEQAYAHLAEYLGRATSDFEIAYRWSGEVMETQDDYPYIGRAPGQAENMLIATGDSGTGMTNGTLAALMLTERVLGRGTPWDDLYDPVRATKGRGALFEWVRENVDNGAKLVGRALMRSTIDDVAELEPGQGAILKKGLKPIAVSRTSEGKLCAVRGLCTHMGCTVKWNHGEESWDCPCHGSRFTPTGEILHGPALKPLESYPLDKLLEERPEKAAERAR